MKWETEQGEILDVTEMGFGHLENSYRMVERRVAEIDAILDELKLPMHGGATLTDEGVAQVYVLKCERLKLLDVLSEFQKEIARRRVELAPGLQLLFDKFFSNQEENSP